MNATTGGTFDVTGKGGISTSNGDALDLNSSGGTSNTPANVTLNLGGTITGHANGIVVTQTGTGDISVTASGSVKGLAGNGITVQDGTAQNSTAGFGNITVDATGQVTGAGTGSIGLQVQNYNAATTATSTSLPPAAPAATLTALTSIPPATATSRLKQAALSRRETPPTAANTAFASSAKEPGATRSRRMTARPSTRIPPASTSPIPARQSRQVPTEASSAASPSTPMARSFWRSAEYQRCRRWRDLCRLSRRSSA